MELTEEGLKQMVQDINRGQTNLDNMKAEIHSFINTMFGFIEIADLPREWYGGQEHEYYGKRFGWRFVHGVVQQGGKPELAIKIKWLKRGDGWREYHSPKQFRCPLSDVEDVYDSLVDLLAMMLHFFPNFKKKLEIHLRAAKKQF
jgi:hypothetical protein